MRVALAIETKLKAALEPEALEIADESRLHAGHAGARPEGESHFRVRVVSSAFDGLGRVPRQRLVYRALAEEMASDIHALAIDARTPDEARSESRSDRTAGGPLRAPGVGDDVPAPR